MIIVDVVILVVCKVCEEKIFLEIIVLEEVILLEKIVIIFVIFDFEKE